MLGGVAFGLMVWAAGGYSIAVVLGSATYTTADKLLVGCCSAVMLGVALGVLGVFPAGLSLLTFLELAGIGLVSWGMVNLAAWRCRALASSPRQF